MKKTLAYAAQQASTPLAPFSIERRDLRAGDVAIDILYCGVCHSDLHTARNEWKGTMYPCVPGHEIIGKVTEVAKDVTDFKPGQIVAVGCMVDSCQSCPYCQKDLEQYCDQGAIFTYNSKDKYDHSITYGGYSKHIVVNHQFVLRVPEQFTSEDYAGVAPLLCAGITTYSPLRHWNVQKGSVVGVVGLGGLGHMAIKLAHAMGAHVVLFTTSPSKKEDAKRLGADEVVISKNEQEMKAQNNRFDFIIDTISSSHQLDPYLECLKCDGILCLVGVPEFPHPAPNVGNLIFKRRSLVGSLIGGIKETQEMLDFCGQHHITSDIELIPIQKINEAYERMLKSDVRYRFVIDISSLES